MGTEDVYAGLFQAGLIFLCLGSIFPLFMRQNQSLANGSANICSLAGGVFTAAAAMHILLTGHSMVMTGWRIVGDVYLRASFDTLSSFFLLIIGTMAAVCALYAQGYAAKYAARNTAGYLGAAMNVFILSLIGVVGMDTSLTFLLFWELMALSSFVLVMFEHERQKVRSGGYMYLVMTHVIGVCLTIAFMVLYAYTGSLAFADYAHIGQLLPNGVRQAVFFLFFVGFGAKMGLFPINVWLPRAYPVAPSSATALMSSAMIKTAVYAFLRVGFDFFGTIDAWCAVVVMLAGAVSAIVGIMIGVIQNDLKRFLAYSSVENMGIICVGIGAALYFRSCGAELLGSLALLGVLYHVLSHAVFKGLLFMGAGAMLTATGTCNIGSLGGLIRRMPWTAGAVLIGVMSLASLPPFGGFLSEWTLLQSLLYMAFDLNGALIKALAIGIITVLGFSAALAAVAAVKHFGIAFLAKPRSESAAQAQEVGGFMLTGMGILCVFSLVLGLYPGGVAALSGAVIGKYFATVPSGNFLLPLPLPAAAAPHGVSPLAALAVCLAAAAVILGAVRFIYGRSRYVLQETWNCGAAHLPVMEYTATSYSQPILRIFQLILGSVSEVKVDGKYAYYPKRIHHHADIRARVGDNVYKPLIGIMVEVFKRVKIIQSGNLQAYLSYIVAALIITLLWIR